MSIDVGSGVVLGIGGSYARRGVNSSREIGEVARVPTPGQSVDFFKWMARQVLTTAEAGHGWLVAGLPGKVEQRDGKVYVGPLPNVPGLATGHYDLAAELNAIDPAVGRLLESNFSLVGVNDGTLVAHAAASRIGENAVARTAALIIGTGVGAGMVEKDNRYQNVYREMNLPLELGYVLIGDSPQDIVQNRISGPALQQTYGTSPSKLPHGHEAWKRVGLGAGRLAAIMGVLVKPDLVVMCGGVGGGMSDYYRHYMQECIQDYHLFGDAQLADHIPEIDFVPPSEANSFELYGGEGVMRDYLTR